PAESDHFLSYKGWDKIMASLPTPNFQQIPTSFGGNGSGIVQGPPPGLMPYGQPAAAQVVDGLGQFMQNYLGMKTAMQEHYKNKFSEGVSLIQQGIPGVDVNKLMK